MEKKMTVLDLLQHRTPFPPASRRAGDGQDVGPSNDWRTGTLVGWVIVAAALLLLLS